MRNGMTQQEVEGEANLQILAGTQTSSMALTPILIHLITSPPAYTCLKREIRQAIDKGTISADRAITNEQALNLDYLQAWIWEGPA